MRSTRRDQDSQLAPVVHELSRITDAIRSGRSADDQALIDALSKEVTELRAAVAHLRASRGPVPHALRPVVARSAVSNGEESLAR
jgi:hypothetical protein